MADKYRVWVGVLALAFGVPLVATVLALFVRLALWAITGDASWAGGCTKGCNF